MLQEKHIGSYLTAGFPKMIDFMNNIIAKDEKIRYN